MIKPRLFTINYKNLLRLSFNFSTVLTKYSKKIIDAVILDNYKGAYDATSYLIKTGHKKIAIVNGRTELPLYKQRFEGYQQALMDGGLKIDDEIILDGVESNGKGYYPVKDLLNSGIRPDAIFATSDLKALAVMRAIKDCGLRIPEDISVIGFDNLDISSQIDPPLTTVAQPLYEMGARAANKLIQLIESKQTIKPQLDILDAELIIRKSTL